MKVGFLGTYSQVQRLVSEPSSAKQGVIADFSQLLASLSPDKRQVADIKEDLPKLKGTTALDHNKYLAFDEARASFSFSEPELTLPAVEEDKTIKEILSTSVNASSESVKTPTMVSAHRVSLSDPFKDLSQAQRQSEVKRLLDDAARKHGVDPALGMAVVSIESSFDATAVSSDGFASKGLMQLLDDTARGQLRRQDEEPRYRPFDPKMNVDLGMGYLRYLHEVFGTTTQLPNHQTTTEAANSASLEKLAVAAYNAGEGRVSSAQERAKREGKDASDYESVAPYLPDSTKTYVEKVMSAKLRFEESNHA